jgi:hypothetical protein
VSDPVTLAVALENSDYLCVAIDVPTAKRAEFISTMPLVLPLFTGAPPAKQGDPITGFGWVLLGAMAHDDPAAGTRFVHVWKVPHPLQPSLNAVMDELATEPNYVTLDQLVDQETQDLMHSTSYTPRNWPVSPVPLYVQETLDMSRSAEDIVAFEDAMNVVIEEGPGKIGWTLLLALMSQTGRLRRYTHFWQIDSADPAKIAAADAWLMSLPGYKPAVLARTTQLFDGIQYQKTG